MILKNLKVENFISHRNSELMLDYGINVITGPNGAGKTSLLDGISFALFNIHSRGRKENLINSRASKSKVAVDFSEGGVSYAVEWIIERNKAAQGALFKVQNGERILLARGGERTIVSEVEKILGIERDLFLQSIYVRQGEIESLVTATPGVRKELISKLLGIEDLQRAWVNMKDVIKEYEVEIARLEGELEKIPEIKGEIEENEVKLKQLNSSLELKRNELKETQAKVEAFQAILRNLEVDKKRHQELDSRKKILEKEIENLELRKQEKQSEFEKAREAYSKVKALEQAIKQLPFLERYVSGLIERKNKELIQSQLLEKLKRITELSKIQLDTAEAHKSYLAKNELLSLKREERRSYEGAEESLRRALKQLRESEKDEANKNEELANGLKIYSEALEEEVNLESLESVLLKKKGELERSRDELENKIEECSQRIGSLKRRKEDLEYNLSQISQAETCPICGRELTFDHIQKLEAEFTTERNRIESEIAALKKEQKKANQGKKECEAKLEELASIDPVRLHNLSAQIAELRAKIAQQREEVKELQEKAMLLKKLDEEIKKLERELVELEEAYQSYEAAKREIARYPAREQLKLQLEPITTALEEINSNLKALAGKLGYEPEKPEEEINELRRKKEEYDRNEPIAKRKPELELEVAEIEKKLLDKKLEHNNVIQEIKKLGYDEKVHKQKEEELKEAEEHKSEASKQIVEIETKIKGLEETLSKLNGELKELAEKEKIKKRMESYIKILEKIREAFGKEGVQKLIRARAKLRLQSFTRDFFEKFNLEYSDIAIDDDYSIAVIGPGGKQDIDQISGGERVALAIALRLAIARVLSNKVETIIMDEPTTHLDEERRRELVNILNSFFREGGRIIPQMLIITHHREVEEAADLIYNVSKKEGYSIVEAAS